MLQDDAWHRQEVDLLQLLVGRNDRAIAVVACDHTSRTHYSPSLCPAMSDRVELGT